VVGLARQTDVLIHEATGAMLGHSSAAQAGEIATRAEAKELLLIHYRTGDFDTRVLIEQARQTFKGPVSLAYDFMSIQF
jgi:ribonuclease BN (tRNA processing enzyme)